MHRIRIEWVCLLLLMVAVGVQAQRVKHPSLLYTNERIMKVKQRIGQEPQMAKAWEELQTAAEQKLGSKRIADLDYLSLAYLMTDDNRYANAIKEVLLQAVKADTWGSAEMLARQPVWRADLGLAHKAYMTAIGYDAVYQQLTSSERKQIAEGLNRLALEPCLGDWLLEIGRAHV